jgi:hypothetical protein
MGDHARVRLVEILHKLGLTEEMVRDHVRNAVLRIELHNVGDGDDDPSDPPHPSGLFYRLNVQKLSSDLHDLLSGCLTGYSMQLRRYGRTIFDQQWKSSTMPGEVGEHDGVKWASDSQPRGRAGS